ncbi:N-acetylserotonin O-methyltransferase-like protein-like [Mucor ambiguus]|uniref:N-acetylserotonin O-methyltransferase-like protein-like n=1 Tax=Mucor ambiguus TaxID=91626 RepID=A0A0C9M1Q9_9FUNG|nr:N-acetylserotonin O-methyltransferase-like protein-like [Mucor ambiguus]
MPLNSTVLNNLSKKTIVLASASPRRREILTDMGLDFSIVTTLEPDENDPTAYKTQAEYVADTAYMKVKEVFERCQQDSKLPTADIVIAADTVVVKDECVLEKPRDKEHALAMLEQLNGQSHYVLTGVQIMYKINDKVERIEFVEQTQVQFSQIDPNIIQAYVDSGEPFDKAGGYGIQGQASLFVESIHGDYWNVASIVSQWLSYRIT